MKFSSEHLGQTGTQEGNYMDARPFITAVHLLGGLIPPICSQHVSMWCGHHSWLLRTRNQMKDLMEIFEERDHFEEHRANTQETRANMEQQKSQLGALEGQQGA
ncbi:hypothetical protein Tco_0497364 [Tanacetum coccineum]